MKIYKLYDPQDEEFDPFYGNSEEVGEYLKELFEINDMEVDPEEFSNLTEQIREMGLKYEEIYETNKMAKKCKICGEIRHVSQKHSGDFRCRTCKNLGIRTKSELRGYLNNSIRKEHAVDFVNDTTSINWVAVNVNLDGEKEFNTVLMTREPEERFKEAINNALERTRSKDNPCVDDFVEEVGIRVNLLDADGHKMNILF